MNKELTPLEVVKLLKDFIFEFKLGNADKLFVNGSFDIIEQALKDKEQLEENYSLLQMRYDDLLQTNKELLANVNAKEYVETKVLKKLKTLEHIRKLNIFDDGQRRIFINGEIDCKSKEEFELLKEVLL